MEEIGFCTFCSQEIPTQYSTVIRQTKASALVISTDRRAHSLVFGQAAESFRARMLKENHGLQAIPLEEFLQGDSPEQADEQGELEDE